MERARGSPASGGAAQTGGEERPAPEALVVARPLLAVGQGLLDAIEGAEAGAEAVDAVDECGLAGRRDHRAAVLERAVVAEDDVQQRLGNVAGEVRKGLDRGADAEVAERDLAVEAP